MISNLFVYNSPVVKEFRNKLLKNQCKNRKGYLLTLPSKKNPTLISVEKRTCKSSTLHNYAIPDRGYLI